MGTANRVLADREPRLRGRADRARIRQFWASSADFKELNSEVESFRASLGDLAGNHAPKNEAEE